MYDPNIGQFLSEDPLSYAAGDTNLRRYVLNSPVNYRDPTGLLVEGIFFREGDTLVLWDIDSHELVVVRAFSGLGKDCINNPACENVSDEDEGPVPAGRYEILEFHGDDDFFRLDALDETPRNDTHKATGRDQFRLHLPGATIGCIAVGSTRRNDPEALAQWEAIRNLLENTETQWMPDASGSGFKGFVANWLGLQKFGEIEVR